MIQFGREAAGGRRRRVVGVLGAQMGKTEGMLNIPGQRLEDDAVPFLYVGPTKSNIEKVAEPRFEQMVRSAPGLYSLWDQSKTATSKTQKRIAGVSFRFAWAGSPTEVASASAAVTLTDELDRMSASVKGEGSPLELIEGRLEGYRDGVSVVVSTPTEGTVETYIDEFGLERWKPADPKDVNSPIWKLWQEGTRHEWAWPCPDCGEYFIPRAKLLWWPEGSTPQQARDRARLICPHCAVQIEDSSKDAMNARGVAVAPGERVRLDGTIEGECERNDVYSVWVSGLCSSWRAWGQKAQRLAAALLSGEEDRVRPVMNTVFGELHSRGGTDAPKASSVEACKSPYVFGEIPPGVRLVTCYVDVQKRSLYYAIRGWGYGQESWLLEAGQILGETEHDDVWDQLADFRDREFAGMRIKRLGIDSGYRPGDKWRRPDNQIYAFCRRHRGWAMCTKSYAQAQKPLSMSLIDITIGGRLIKAGLKLWRLDADYFKSWVHARLEWPQDKPGGWHVPQDVTKEYCEQLVAEARVVKPSGAVGWVELRKANHYLDCEAGNTAVAHSLGLHRRGQSRIKNQPTPALAQSADQPIEQPEPEIQKTAPRPERHKIQRPARRGWVRNW